MSFDTTDDIASGADEHIDPIEQQIETCTARLDEAEKIDRSLRQNGRVDQLTVSSLERIAEGEVLPATTPKQSFTRRPSEQNLDIALEASSWTKIFTLLALGAAVAGLIYKLVDQLSSGTFNDRKERTESAKQKYKDYKQRSSAYRTKPPEDPKEREKFDTIQKGHYRPLLTEQEIKSNASETQTVIDLLRPNGQVFQYVSTLSANITQQLDDLHENLQKLNQVLDKFLSSSQPDTKQLKEQIEQIVPSDKRGYQTSEFIETIEELDKIIEENGLDEQFPSLLQERVRLTPAYIEFLESNSDWLDAIDKIWPSRFDQIDEHLNDLKKLANELSEKQQKAKKHHSTDEDVTFGPAIRTSDKYLRKKTRSLLRYRSHLAKLERFYSMCSRDLARLEQRRSEYLRQYVQRR